MKILRGSAAVVILTASVVLGGCGGMTMAGPGAALGLDFGTRSPAMRLAPASCLTLGGGLSPIRLNAAAMAGERMRQVHQLQSRFNLASSDIRATRAGWRSVAEGGC